MKCGVGWRRFGIVAVCGMAVAGLQGCSSSPGTLASRLTDRGRLLADGPAARLTPEAVAAWRDSEVPLLYVFAVQARAAAPGSTTVDQQQAALAGLGAAEWAAVTRAGEAYVDRVCLVDFVGALNRLEREKKATLAQLNAVGSATVGILGLARAAQQSIGAVGIAFGLVASLFDTSVSSYLFELPTSGVARVIAAQRDALRAEDEVVLAQVRSQFDASARLSEYVQYCAPVTIEANISGVLSASRERGGLIEATAIRPAITSALAHGVPFKQTADARDQVADRVARLDPQRALSVLRLMLPRLSTREPMTQARLQPLLTRPGGPLASPARATTFLGLWVQTEIMTPANEAEWLTALGGAL